MKLIFVVIICLVASTLSMKISHESFSLKEYSDDNDDFPWGSIVEWGAYEAMGIVKMMAIMKVKGTCLNVQMTKKLMDICKTCAIETATKVMARIGATPFGPKTFDHEDFLYAHNVFYSCKAKSVNLDINDNIDLETFRSKLEEIFEMVSQDTETKDVLMEAMNICSEKFIKGGRGSEAIKQITKTDICMVDRVLEHCKQEEKDAGLILKVKKAVLSIVDDPKCVATVGPLYLRMPFELCLKKANDKWMNVEKLPFKFVLRSNNDKENIKETWNFFKNYFKHIIVETLGCVGMEMGFLTKTEKNMDFSKTNLKKFFDDLRWNNGTEKTAFLNMFSECLPEDDDPKLARMNNMIEMTEAGSPMNKMLIMMKLLVYKIKEGLCLCPKFLETCGLNSEVARIQFPLLNYDAMNMFTRDLMNKGAAIAGMHIMGILRDGTEFSSIFNSI